MSDRVKLAREIAARTERRFIGDQARAAKAAAHEQSNVVTPGLFGLH